MLEIASRYGKWNDHDWHLLCRDKNKEYIFYAPTLRLVLHLSQNLAEPIYTTGHLPEPIIRRLIKNRKVSVVPVVERPKTFHLAIGLTNNCTLACDYCHAEADRDTTINHDLIAKSIDYAFKRIHAFSALWPFEDHFQSWTLCSILSGMKPINAGLLLPSTYHLASGN